MECACSSADRVPGYEPVGRGFESPQARQKETTIFERRLSFLFVLCTFLSNCRFQRKGSFALQNLEYQYGFA